MQNLFTLGHGRALHRSVCEVIGMEWLLPLTPGGTRMITYLGDTPGRFIKNFRSYYFALDLKNDHCEAKRSTKSKKVIVGIGRKLGRVHLVVFAMGMAAVFEKHIQPYARETQAARTMQWVRFRSQQRLLDALSLAEANCKKFLADWRIFFLIRHYLPRKDAHRYWFALVETRWSRHFPLW